MKRREYFSDSGNHEGINPLDREDVLAETEDCPESESPTLQHDLNFNHHLVDESVNLIVPSVIPNEDKVLQTRSESEMIEKIAADVSNVVNDSVPSIYFESLIGIGVHMEKMRSLLSLECDEVRMVGIWGPAGIGKTTIARAL
uniref:NB-ARC domain-containing protein n=4 Tax=Brassica TaxID=3705 RepID=A0A0D2ZRW4_BRAOL